MQPSATPVAATLVEPNARAAKGSVAPYARPDYSSFAAVVPARSAQTSGLLHFQRRDIKPISGTTGALSYRAVVHSVPVAIASLIAVCMIATEIVLMYFTVWKATTEGNPDAQSAFYTNNSWCFITPSEDDDDYGCVRPDLRAAVMTPSDYYDGEPCEVDSDAAYAFCNTDPNITIEWCKEIFDTIVDPSACWSPKYTFSTPSNYSSVGYDFVHEDVGFSYSIWGSVGSVHVWGILSIVYLAMLPRSLQRTEDALVLRRNCCCASKVPLQSVRALFAAESFRGFDPHQYSQYGPHRPPTTKCCTVGVRRPTVWLVHGGRIPIAASLSRHDYDRFLAENIQFRAASSDVEANVAVAVAVHNPEPAKPQTV